LEKLSYFKKYLDAYLLATKRLPVKFYIDAFAGSGKCKLCDEKCKSKGGVLCEKCSKGKLIDGSAMISLKSKYKFNGYIFVELKKKNIKYLIKFIKFEINPEIKKNIKIEQGDSNVILKNIYKYINKYTGCLIFLDPEGPELYWDTVQFLAKINKVDLLMLYPYDMSLVRLTKDYKDKLNKFYGSEKWLEINKSKENFSPERRKSALLKFYIENLKKLGFQHVVYKQIRRNLRSGKALYHLILATHSSAGKKIMESIFNKELDGQQKMKLI
jgi:three-Cys-motif partner protein